MNEIMSFYNQPELYIPFLIWSFLWKGLALWKSASKKQLIWFIALLVINTMGILEILYIFFLNRWDIDNGKTLKFIEEKRKGARK